jgi:hypothetical protein
MVSELDPEVILVAAKLGAFPEAARNVPGWTLCGVCGAPTDCLFACHITCFVPNFSSDFDAIAKLGGRPRRFVLTPEQVKAISHLVKP